MREIKRKFYDADEEKLNNVLDEQNKTLEERAANSNNRRNSEVEEKLRGAGLDLSLLAPPKAELGHEDQI